MGCLEWVVSNNGLVVSSVGLVVSNHGLVVSNRGSVASKHGLVVSKHRSGLSNVCEKTNPTGIPGWNRICMPASSFCSTDWLIKRQKCCTHNLRQCNDRNKSPTLSVRLVYFEIQNANSKINSEFKIRNISRIQSQK